MARRRALRFLRNRCILEEGFIYHGWELAWGKQTSMDVADAEMIDWAGNLAGVWEFEG
jgi:hypothetical protein